MTGQTLLPNGENIYGSAPVSGFNCYAVNASINSAVNINVTLNADTPVEILGNPGTGNDRSNIILVSRDPNVCSRQGKTAASFVVNTPIDNTYSLSFLSYADGAQYIAVFNLGSSGASFNIQVDTGKLLMYK